MAIEGATLKDIRATSAKVNIPAWGCWFAEVALDGEHSLTGVQTLKLADIALTGTIISGGPQQGRTMYRIVGGKGGWGRTLKRRAYANDAGVKLVTVLQDAAAEAGEVLGDVSQDTRIGPAYVRPAGLASASLQELASQGWYVDETGTTRIGSRPATAFTETATRTQPLDKARGKIVLAAEKIASIVPGVVIDNMTVVDVAHEISAGGGLRTTVWGSTTPSTLNSLALLLAQLDPNRLYRGVTEYRVVSQSGNRLDLQPIRVSLGLPELERVPVRPGTSGMACEPALGSRVLVGFVDSDPTRPYVAGFEDEDGEGYEPLKIRIQSSDITMAEGVLGAARMTDAIQAGPFSGVIVGGSTKVKVG